MTPSSETHNTEFKTSWHDDYLKWVCGFANADGGVIFIGKDDSGSVTGLPDHAKLMEDIPNKIRNAMGIICTYMGATVQLRVYDDRLSIWNEGTLPNGLTLEDLKKEHSSRPRNPILANACFLGGYIDTWGRGTLKIINSCRHAGLPEPEIIETNGGVAVTLFNSEKLRKTTGKVRKKFGESSEKSSEKIILLISKKPSLSARELADKLKLTPRAVEKQIAVLKKENRIRRIGPAKGGYWEMIDE